MNEIQEAIKDIIRQDALLHYEGIRIKIQCIRCGEEFLVEDIIKAQTHVEFCRKQAQK